MKQTITQALQAAEQIIYEEQPIAAYYMTEEWLAVFMASIYYFNDLGKEITQRINNVTVIATQYSISLIIGNHATRYGSKSLSALCEYENLENDLTNILLYIETCFQRIDLD